MSTFNTIVFDLGGVLMKHDREGFVRAMREIVREEKDITEVIGLGNNLPGTLRERYEVGEIESEEFVMGVRACCKSGTTDEQVIEVWNTIHAGIEDSTWAEVRRLKERGHKIYLLSNTDAIHWAHTMALYGKQIEELFDEVFLSFRVGLAKPDSTFYHLVNDAIYAEPERILFVDDTEVNRCAAEESVGWKTCAKIEELNSL